MSDESFYRVTLSRLLEGALRPDDLSRKARNRFMRIAKRKEDRDRVKIAECVKGGEIARAFRLQRSYLHAVHNRLVAANYATRSSGEDGSRRFRQVYQRALKIGFGHVPGEMQLRKKPKAGGGTRITGSFSPDDKAQQKLMASAITPFYGDHPEQFA